MIANVMGLAFLVASVQATITSFIRCGYMSMDGSCTTELQCLDYCSQIDCTPYGTCALVANHMGYTWNTCFTEGVDTIVTCTDDGGNAGTPDDDTDDSDTDDDTDDDNTDDDTDDDNTDDDTDDDNTDDDTDNADDGSDDDTDGGSDDDTGGGVDDDTDNGTDGGADNDTSDCGYDLCITMCTLSPTCEGNCFVAQERNLGADDGSCDKVFGAYPGYVESGTCFDHRGIGMVITCNASSSSSGSDTGMIVGIVVGVVVFICIIIGVVLYRKNQTPL